MIWLLASSAFAEPDVTVEAQVRPRAEAHSGRDLAEGGEVVFVTQRARLGATARLNELSARVVIQDVRAYGEELSTLTDDSADGLDAHFAYLQWDINKNAGLRLGRQEFILHEHRLIGNVGWLQQARAFNGLKAWGSNDTISAELNAALTATEVSEAYEGNAALVYARVGRVGDQKADLVYIMDASSDRERALSTAGAYATFGSGTLSGRAEGYYQFGRTDGLDVSAYMGGAQVTIAPQDSLKLTLWYDHLSGNGDDASTKGAFDTLYATNHKFYGLTDIAWFLIGATADGRGLQDGALKVSVAASERVTVKAEAHALLVSNGDGYIGAEPDVTVSYRAAKGLTLAGGAGVFLPDEGTMESWGFLQVNAAL